MGKGIHGQVMGGNEYGGAFLVAGRLVSQDEGRASSDGPGIGYPLLPEWAGYWRIPFAGKTAVNAASLLYWMKQSASNRFSQFYCFKQLEPR